MAQFKMVSLKKAEEEDIEDDVASEDANEDSEEEENDSDAGELVAKESEESRTEKLTRTIFIGNLPSNFPLKELKKNLSEFGGVASIRVRSVAPSKQTLSKKVAFLSKQIHPGKNNVNAYVVYKSIDSIEKALSLNGTEFKGHTIQVDRVDGQSTTYENVNSVFLGNLAFKTTEDELREFFKDCGEIQSVRLIRDSKTGMGKGFGYVNFKAKDGVVLAIEKNGQQFKGREVRIQTYHYNKAHSGKGNKKCKQFPKQGKSPAFAGKQGKPAFKGKPKNIVKSPKGAGGESKPKKSVPVTQEGGFKGEVASKKKFVKKTLKNRIKSNKVTKQKKNIAEIFSKKK